MSFYLVRIMSMNSRKHQPKLGKLHQKETKKKILMQRLKGEIRSRCESIANEILMHFRSQKKLQGEVSLSDTLETDKDGNSLFLLDIVGVEDTMLEDLEAKDACLRLRRLVRECLTEREADIIERRYGLCGRSPKTQRELASDYNISRSYVSRLEKKALEKLKTAMDGIDTP